MDLGKAKLDLEINANGAVRQFLRDVIAEFEKMLAEFDARHPPPKGDAEAATVWCESPAAMGGATGNVPLPPKDWRVEFGDGRIYVSRSLQLGYRFWEAVLLDPAQDAAILNDLEGAVFFGVDEAPTAKP